MRLLLAFLCKTRATGAVAVSAGGDILIPDEPTQFDMSTSKVPTFLPPDNYVDGTAISGGASRTYRVWRSTTEFQARPGGTGATNYTPVTNGVAVSSIPSGLASFTVDMSVDGGVSYSDVSNESRVTIP